ncbi:glutaredoxin [Candidatus Poribacteria bacterium]|nr:glutaredoxin [Candidatus Poribacteria bacterium]
MGLIKESQQEQLKEKFKDLDEKIKLIVFTQEMECQYCRETRGLMEDLADLADKIDIEVYDFVNDKEKVEEYNIDKIPATVVEGEKDYGVRFYGIPAGYEFTSLVATIMNISSSESELSEKTIEELKKIDKPLNIDIFVTLTCPYCPNAVEIAHKLAKENDFIKSNMIESSEFPELMQKNNITSVPTVVVNNDMNFPGNLPEKEFVDNLIKAVT